jgi:hypothetical protein
VRIRKIATFAVQDNLGGFSHHEDRENKVKTETHQVEPRIADAMTPTSQLNREEHFPMSEQVSCRSMINSDVTLFRECLTAIKFSRFPVTWIDPGLSPRSIQKENERSQR